MEPNRDPSPPPIALPCGRVHPQVPGEDWTFCGGIWDFGAGIAQTIDAGLCLMLGPG